MLLSPLPPCYSAFEEGFDHEEDFREDSREGVQCWRGFQRRGPKYATFITTVYNEVTEARLPNYLGVCLQLSSNLHFREWEALAHTEDDTRLVDFLKYGFPVGYDGPVPIPADNNHISAMHNPWDVAAYVLTELEEGGNAGSVLGYAICPVVSSECSPHLPEE